MPIENKDLFLIVLEVGKTKVKKFASVKGLCLHHLMATGRRSHDSRSKEVRAALQHGGRLHDERMCGRGRGVKLILFSEATPEITNPLLRCP
jgi:hypothetical protein